MSKCPLSIVSPVLEQQNCGSHWGWNPVHSQPHVLVLYLFKEACIWAHRVGLSRMGSSLIQGLVLVLLEHMMGCWNMDWEKSFYSGRTFSFLFFLMLTPHSSESLDALEFFIIYPWTCSAAGKLEYESHRQILVALLSFCCSSKFMWCLSPCVKAAATVAMNLASLISHAHI